MTKKNIGIFYIIFGVVVSVAFASIFPLVSQLVVKGVTSSTYMTGSFIALVGNMIFSAVLINEKIRDKILHNLIEWVIVIDCVAYSLIVWYSISIDNFAFRYIAMSILSGSTTILWQNITGIPIKKIFIGDELIDLTQKSQLGASIGALVGASLGILLATLNLSYSLLCVYQIITILFVGVFDIYILVVCKRFMKENGIK